VSAEAWADPGRGGNRNQGRSIDEKGHRKPRAGAAPAFQGPAVLNSGGHVGTWPPDAQPRGRAVSDLSAGEPRGPRRPAFVEKMEVAGHQMLARKLRLVRVGLGRMSIKENSGGPSSPPAR